VAFAVAAMRLFARNLSRDGPGRFVVPTLRSSHQDERGPTASFQLSRGCRLLAQPAPPFFFPAALLGPAPLTLASRLVASLVALRASHARRESPAHTAHGLLPSWGRAWGRQCRAVINPPAGGHPARGKSAQQTDTCNASD
jgi:hypothetical protein